MWYFKGRKRRYKSPYTGKEVDASVKKSEDTTSTAEEIDAAVAKASTIPDVSAENSGEFLRVNADGKIEATTYPFTEDKTSIYNGDVTTETSGTGVVFVTYSADITVPFDEWNVVVDDKQFSYIVDFGVFGDPDDLQGNILVSNSAANHQLTLTCRNDEVGTHSVNVYISETSIDEQFAEGVKEASGIPDTTVADAGKVLGVTDEGKIALVEASGGKLYIHKIISIDANFPVSVIIINTDNTAFTKTTLIQYLKDKGFDNAHPLTGTMRIRKDGTKVLLTSGINYATHGSTDVLRSNQPYIDLSDSSAGTINPTITLDIIDSVVEV